MKTPIPAAKLITYAIGLCFAVVVVSVPLALIHQSFSHTYPLVRVRTDGDHATVVLDSAVPVPVGQRLAVYRFHDGFRTELCEAVAVQSSDGLLTAEVDLTKAVFPLGRQGRIAARLPERAFLLEMDPGHPLDRDSTVNVYEQHAIIAQLRIDELRVVDGTRYAVARIASPSREAGIPSRDVLRDGLIYSEYTVQTTVSVLERPVLLAWLEALAILLALAAETWVFWRRGHGCVALAGLGAVRVYQSWSSRRRQWLKRLLVTAVLLPTSYLVGSFLCYSFYHVPRLLHLPPVAIPLDTRWVFTTLLLAAAACVAHTYRQNPLTWLWRKAHFEPRGSTRFVPDRPLLIKLVHWTLNLVIVYAFGFALIGFLSANVNSVLGLLAPSHVTLDPVAMTLSRPSSIYEWAKRTLTAVHILDQSGLRELTLDQYATVLRLLIWSVTIVGCLVGYVHSVLQPFFATTIRNVDFTPMGWLVNGICYGPLLGAVAWSVLPTHTGPFPIVTQGPLFLLALVMELLANALYTSSIWNMGTKFGVMVDKGMVTTGFFAAVRHPSYTLESVMFYFYCLRGLSFGFNWVGVFFVFVLYWLRSERDEVFMAASNPEYGPYREQVPWKYVPGLV